MWISFATTQTQPSSFQAHLYIEYLKYFLYGFGPYKTVAPPNINGTTNANNESLIDGWVQENGAQFQGGACGSSARHHTKMERIQGETETVTNEEWVLAHEEKHCSLQTQIVVKSDAWGPRVIRIETVSRRQWSKGLICPWDCRVWKEKWEVSWS